MKPHLIQLAIKLLSLPIYRTVKMLDHHPTAE